ncbi:LysR family transcriptional regulator [Mycolicibacterium sp. 018/SC-01/001]|uniref:LysR family transcriptional regulator n=1 Tax=Mycolicibacterium sp. 018/SC-01/001 TaxID=2592069 RepID=UPI00117D221E|nr:LysR family transcriptional regulator [Mycolicibacterium sp. 018/SC-01/001]TRW89084.1 LysR family transcriptional regulator [Mycolicibacterium sp. 018/SC-01/001]
MELRTLEYFLAVAEEESFTRAAQKCFVTQPSISAQIQGLERELGESLFDRTQRTTVLTDGGRLLLPFARECVRAANDAKAEFSARAGLLRGELRIGTGGGVEHTTIPVLLGELRQKYPGVDVEVVEATSGPLLDMVLQNRLHVAVIAKPAAALPPNVSSSPMFTDEIVAVYDPTVFPLGDVAPIPLHDIVDHPVITYPLTSALRGAVERVAAEAQIVVSANIAANDARLQVAFAQQGLGIALTVRSDPALRDTGLTIRPINPRIGFDKVLIWRTDLVAPAPLRAFLDLWANVADTAP